MSFHPEGAPGKMSASRRRSVKERRVREGRAHAALVYDNSTLVGWCQFGSHKELTRIKLKRDYLAGLTQLPDWRITCFFVDRGRRGRGVASAALNGALHEIARLGGSRVESYPEEPEGRSIWRSFLYNGTVSMFEREEFKRSRRLGKNHWVVTKVVRPSRAGSRLHLSTASLME